MRCPFLREAQVKSCHASSFKKMILRSTDHPDMEKCSSPDYVNCAAAKQHHEEEPDGTRCPFLQESLVQYCSAAPVVKYVPYSESMLTRCGTDNHRYCESYLSLAQPEKHHDGNTDDISLPDHLSYSDNHMWLDVSEDGTCHVGVDALAARVFTPVESISFISHSGDQRPAAVLTIHGVDMQMVFPNRMAVTATNSSLRSNLGNLFRDPYYRGWLFEGRAADGKGTTRAGLRRDAEARKWMDREIRRMSEFIHSHVTGALPAGERFAMDGGIVHESILRQMNREEALRLYHEFFSPYAPGKQ
jgi:glycine cleavage system H lipoate-binding protein